MKKILSIAILFVIVLAMGGISVNAATSADLADTLYSMGSKYGLTSADKVKIERYISEYGVTDDQANQIVAKAEEAVKVFENANVTSFSDLSTAQKDQLKTIANEAASVIDVQLTFTKGNVKVYKNGILIESVTNNNGKLSYTGNLEAEAESNNTNTILVVSSIAVVALATITVFIARKKFANA